MQNKANGILFCLGQKGAGATNTLFSHTGLGLLEQSVRRLFTHEGADVVKTDSSSKFVLDSLKLSIFDAHLEYMKDFGANLESSLRRQDEKAVVFVEELDEDLELVKESSDIISSLPMVPVSKGIYTRINVRSVEHFQQLMKREELLRKNIQDQDKAKGINRA